jgi:uncharacterized protein YhhL (DUF1145 family)
MLIPPPLPAQALKAGKIAVGSTWVLCLLGVLLPMPTAQLTTVAQVVILFLAVSHIIELVIFSAFLKAAKASSMDYVQAFIFGMFHTGSMKIAA